MMIAAHLLIEPFGCDAIEVGQIAVEHDSMPADNHDFLSDTRFFKVAICDLGLHRLWHTTLLSHPQVSIQRSILDSFGKMLRGEVVFSGKISDSSSDFENAVVSAG